MAHKIDEISSLSTAEYIKLVASYSSALIGKEDFDPALLAKGYSPAAIAEAKRMKEKKFSPVEMLGLRFTRPLSNFRSDILGYVWMLFENYERGLLPFSGSVSEQPAQIMEIFGVFQALRSERQHKENERAKERNSRKR